jgi:hypothetical protein
MSHEDTIAELLRGLPGIRPKTDEEIVRSLAARERGTGWVTPYSVLNGTPMRKCVCGNFFEAESEQVLCGRCLGAH